MRPIKAIEPMVTSCHHVCAQQSARSQPGKDLMTALRFLWELSQVRGLAEKNDPVGYQVAFARGPGKVMLHVLSEDTLNQATAPNICRQSVKHVGLD